MTNFVFRKELSRNVVDGKETVIFDYFEKSAFLTSDELFRLVEELFSDDPEESYYGGISQGFEGDIYSIDVDKLSDSIEDAMDDIERDQDTEDNNYYDFLKDVFERLKPFAEFDVYLKEVEKK